MPESSDRGALTEAVFYILLSLYTPMHGYAMMQNIRDISGGRVSLGPGTLYGALSALIERRWIAALPDEADSRKKEYIITDTGRTAVQTELVRLAELLENGKRVAGGDGR